MKTLTPFALLLALTSPLAADELRPAPDYYVETLFALTMAEALATSCPDIGMDLLAAGARTSDLRDELAADGFEPNALSTQMIDPAPALRDLQAAFLEKHPGLGDPDEASVCGAARAEMAQDTLVGTYLFEGVE